MCERENVVFLANILQLMMSNCPGSKIVLVQDPALPSSNGEYSILLFTWEKKHLKYVHPVGINVRRACYRKKTIKAVSLLWVIFFSIFWISVWYPQVLVWLDIFQVIINVQGNFAGFCRICSQASTHFVWLQVKTYDLGYPFCFRLDSCVVVLSRQKLYHGSIQHDVQCFNNAGQWGRYFWHSKDIPGGLWSCLCTRNIETGKGFQTANYR